MKKLKIISGILLMIIGMGISAGSVTLHYFEHSKYGFWVNGFELRRNHNFKDFNSRKAYPKPNQNQKAIPKPQR